MIFWIDFLCLGKYPPCHFKLPRVEHKYPASLAARKQVWDLGFANKTHESDTVLEVCNVGDGARGMSLVPRERSGRGMTFWWWRQQHLCFPVVQGRISGTNVAAGLVSLAVVVTLVSWHLVLNSFRVFPSGPFLQLGVSDATRSLTPNVFLSHL